MLYPIIQREIEEEQKSREPTWHNALGGKPLDFDIICHRCNGQGALRIHVDFEKGTGAALVLVDIVCSSCQKNVETWAWREQPE